MPLFSSTNGQKLQASVLTLSSMFKITLASRISLDYCVQRSCSCGRRKGWFAFGDFNVARWRRLNRPFSR